MAKVIKTKITADTTQFERSMRSARDAAADIGRTLAVGIAAAGAAATLIGTKALGMASDMEETQGKFNVVFRGMGEQAEAWSKTLVESYAMSSVESKKFLSNIQDLLVPTGMAREEAGKLSNEFVKMAADLGSFNNLPTETVIRDIQSALQGSSETMAKYGINVKQAKVEQEIFNLGLANSKEEITDAHKAQAIYSIMLREGSDALGDMARTADSFANQQKKATANVTDFMTEIGQGLLPIATETVNVFNDWFKVNGLLLAQDIAGWIGSAGEVVVKTIGFFREMDDFFKFMIGNMLIGWEKMSYDFQLGTLAIKSSFFLAFDAIQEKTADVIDNIAEKVGKLPLIGDNIAASFNDASDGLRNASTASEDFNKEVERLTISHQYQVEAIKDVQDEIFEKEKVAVKAEKSIQKEVEKSTAFQVKSSKEVLSVQEKNQAAFDAVFKKSLDGNQRYFSMYNNEQRKQIESYTDSWARSNDTVSNDYSDTLDLMQTETASWIERLTEGEFETLAEGWSALWTSLEYEATTIIEAVGGEISTWISDVIDNKFDSLGDAWDSLWSGMLDTVVRTVADMAVEFAVDYIVSSFFHDGAWNLKHDEYIATLQAGEMVIPRDDADDIRGSLGDNMGGAGFGVLARAARQLGGNNGQEGEFGLGGVSGDGFGPGGSLAADRAATEGVLGSSTYGNLGEFAGNLAGRAGISASPIAAAPGAATVGGLLGGMAGRSLLDMLGDLFNDREYEDLRDLAEDGMLTASEMQGRKTTRDVMAEITGGSPHGSFLGGIVDAYNDIMGNLKGWAVGLFQDAAGAGFDIPGYSVQGYGAYAGMGLGLGQEGKGLGGDIGPGEGGTDGVGGARGSGDEGSSDPGGRGGYSQGGMVDSLFVPRGDDGLGGLKFGERVLSVRQNDNLTRMLDSGSIGSDNVVTLLKRLIEVVQKSANENITVNVQIGQQKLNNLIESVVVDRNRRGIRPTERVYVAG